MIDEFVNKIICGDCLQVMAEMPKGYIRLIYIDPPFGFDGDRVFGMPKWSTLDYPVNRIDEILPIVPRDIGMRNYLRWLFDRIQQAYRVLKNTGSIYLHCDPTASHYLKIVMDTIFLAENFRNEIIWQKVRTKKAQTTGFGNVHDTIFFYSKSTNRYFKTQFMEFKPEYIKSHYKKDPVTGKLYQDVSLLQSGQGPARRFGHRTLEPPYGKHWIWSQERIDEAMDKGRIYFTAKGRPRKIQYLDEMDGDIVDDIWTDIYPINSMAKERLGYPTQKPEALLDRIIKVSSNEGDTVLDPFCGCGTTIAVAERLKRKWIGIDISPKACEIAEQRIAAELAQPDLLATGD